MTTEDTMVVRTEDTMVVRTEDTMVVRTEDTMVVRRGDEIGDEAKLYAAQSKSGGGKTGLSNRVVQSLSSRVGP